jgi:hypothetical protein
MASTMRTSSSSSSYPYTTLSTNFSGEPEQFGFVSFRTTNRGTIAKILGPEMFDINVDMPVTDRAEQHSSSTQTAPKQHSSST